MTIDHKLSDRAVLQYFPGVSRPWQIVVSGIEDRRNHVKQVAISLTDEEMTMIYVGQRARHLLRLWDKHKDLTQAQVDELLKQWNEEHNG